MGPLTTLAAEVLAGGALPDLPLRTPATASDGARALSALASAAPRLEVWGLRAEAALAAGDLRAAAAAIQAWAVGGGDPGALDMRLGAYLTGPATFRVFDDDALAPTALLVALVQALPSVVRLQRPGAAVGHGSGFVVEGGALHPSLSGERLVLTNAHVCSDDPADHAQGALPPSALRVAHFDAADAQVAEHPITKVLWRSAPDTLDASLLRLGAPIGAAPLTLSEGDVRRGRTLALPIGYPDGGDRAFALPPRPVEAVERQWVSYRSATRGGMSGSPVFNAQAQVIALHHAGDADDNEGVLISVIRAVAAGELG